MGRIRGYENKTAAIYSPVEIYSQRSIQPLHPLRSIPFAVSPTLVYGPSMLPTLNFTGDVLLVEKMSPLLGKVGPGDVVLVRSPENPSKCITKRIVGVADDTVSFLVDPGHSDRSNSRVIPKGHAWIQGDNIYASRDSRQLGPIPYGLILGNVFCRAISPREELKHKRLTI